MRGVRDSNRCDSSNRGLRVLALALTLTLGACANVVTAPANADRTNATAGLAVVQLPKLPDENILSIQVGQQVQLPSRQPGSQWQLDFDPAYWQQLDASDPQQGVRLRAVQAGRTELLQREQATAAGGPAARQFVYPIEIRQ